MMRTRRRQRGNAVAVSGGVGVAMSDGIAMRVRRFAKSPSHSFVSRRVLCASVTCVFNIIFACKQDEATDRPTDRPTPPGMENMTPAQRSSPISRTLLFAVFGQAEGENSNPMFHFQDTTMIIKYNQGGDVVAWEVENHCNGTYLSK